MGTPNYAKLVIQGRVKAYGVPWSDGEMQSLLSIVKAYSYPTWAEAAAYVRRGAKSPKDVEKLRKEDEAFRKENGNVPVEAMTREELEERVREVDPNTTITKDAPTEVLRDVAKETEAQEPKAAKEDAPKNKGGDKKK